MIIYLIGFILGFLLGYLLFAYIEFKAKHPLDTGDILYMCMCGVLSWIGVILNIIFFIVMLIIPLLKKNIFEILSNKKNTKYYELGSSK